MFNNRPEGTISKRKLRRVYPFITHPDMPATIIELMWTVLNAMVPLAITPYFPKALGILWDALQQIEELKNKDMSSVDYLAEIAEMMEILEKEKSDLGKN